MQLLYYMYVSPSCCVSCSPSSSPDYDDEVHMTSGSAFFINYRQPDGTFNTVKASFKEQAESFIEQLRNPDSELYQTTEEA